MRKYQPRMLQPDQNVKICNLYYSALLIVAVWVKGKEFVCANLRTKRRSVPQSMGSQGEVMSVRNALVLLLSTSALLFLAGCGGNGATITNPVAPPSGAFSANSLNGTYVFSVSGADFGGAPLAIVGTLTANGSGGITGGAVDISDAQITPVPNVSVGGGSYNVSVDGRGRATLILSNSRFASTLLLDFVLSSSSHGLVIELDSNGSGSGTLDLQTAGVTPTGTYAFSLSGARITGSTATPWATVGNFTLSGATIAGTDDFNEGGLPFPAQTLTG